MADFVYTYLDPTKIDASADDRLSLVQQIVSNASLEVVQYTNSNATLTFAQDQLNQSDWYVMLESPAIPVATNQRLMTLTFNGNTPDALITFNTWNGALDGNGLNIYSTTTGNSDTFSPLLKKLFLLEPVMQQLLTCKNYIPPPRS